MQTILSGIKPTGARSHLGNYLGAIKQWVDMQDSNAEVQNFYFLANYHALTTQRDGQRLSQDTWNILRECIACGLNPDISTIFVQSDIPEVTELTWIFNCLSPMGLLERAHAYKDALAKGKEANVGLFDYPVLMAADILVYQSTHVPVGKDQKQHVEIARDLAEKFNHHYGETFVLPQPVTRADVAVIPGIDGEKMSKSYNNTIDVFEDEKSIVKKIMSLKTDSKGVDEPKELEDNLVYSYLQLVGKPDTVAHVKQKFLQGGMGYGEAKKILAQDFLDYFSDMRRRYNSITQAELETIVKNGAAKARPIAQKMLQTVRAKVGLL